jgi:hypothetical protein
VKIHTRIPLHDDMKELTSIEYQYQEPIQIDGFTKPVLVGTTMTARLWLSIAALNATIIGRIITNMSGNRPL